MKTAYIFVFLLLPLAVIGVNAANSCGDTNHVCTIDSNVSSDTTWIDGNTYVLLTDVNITGSATDLTIQPGAVVKFSLLHGLIVTDGGRIVANGTSDKNIVFTSCKDQNAYTGSTNVNTSTITGCSGAPSFNDYNTAIFVKANAGMSKSDSFSYLRFLDANKAIRLDLNIGSVHDSNFAFLAGASYGIYVNVASDINLFNNTFSNLSSSNGIAIVGTYTGAIYNNKFTNLTLVSNGITFNVLTNTFSGAVYNNTFDVSSGYGIRINSGTFSGTVYSNTFSTTSGGRFLENDGVFSGSICNNTTSITAGIGIYNTTTFSGIICNNTFSPVSNGTGIYNGPIGVLSGLIYNNTFSTLTSSAKGFRNDNTFSGAIYNNRFLNISSGQGIHNGTTTATFSGPTYNNTFSNIQSGAGVYGINNNGTWSGTISRNLFANVTTDMNGTYTGSITYNARYNVTTPGGTPAQHANDQNSETGFTTDPFIADNSDRNFLLNTVSTGGAKLVDAGGVDSNSVDINNFFNLKTTQLSNKLDTQTIDIGYHADQNAPYVQVLSPSDYNTIGGTQSIDFNFESGYGAAAALTARLAYATTVQTSTTGGTQIVSQALSSYSCSAGPVFRCSYSWDLSALADANYFIVLTGIDSNGSRVDNSDNNFAVANDSVAPTTTADYNNAWQNTDANVGLTCTDTSGCALTQYRIDSDSTSSVSMGVWTTYSGAGILFSSDGNWAIDYNSTDARGNRETTNRIYVLIDKTLPTLSLTITNLTVSGLSASFSYSGSATSGIKKYWISSDGGSTYEDNGSNTDYSFSISPSVKLPHTQRVYIKAQNNADVNTAAQAVDIKFESASGGTTKLCGNNVCDPSETAAICPLDCDSVCGDHACTHIENNSTCPIDCAVGCGNQICESTESSANCPVDCGYTYDDENPSTPPVEIIPQTNPDTGAPRQCAKNPDCEDDNLCTANRCIKGTCYAIHYPDGEPCDVGSVCQNHACIKIAKPYIPPAQADPIFIVSVAVILLVLGAIAFEYLKK